MTIDVENLYMEMKKPTGSNAAAAGYNPHVTHALAAQGLSVSNEPGLFKNIDKNLIQVDHLYQRDNVSEQKIKRIAAHFDWLPFGVLLVVQRPDNVLVCVDGQHRLMAARMRKEIDKVPCMVFFARSVKSEAAAFLRSNTERKNVGSLEKHKAAIVAGVHVNLLVQSVVQRNGYEIVETVAEHLKHVGCVAALLRAATTNEGLFEKVFRQTILVCEGKSITVRIFEGLFVLAQLTKEDSLRGFWTDVMVKIGREQIERSIQSAIMYYGRGHASICARGIANACNKGRRVNRLLDDEAANA